MGRNVIQVEGLVCLSLLALVSAMVFFSKYLLIALIYAVALASTDQFDRNAFLDGLVDVEIPVAAR